LELRLECPNCKFKYSPTLKDESSHPDVYNYLLFVISIYLNYLNLL